MHFLSIIRAAAWSPFSPHMCNNILMRDTIDLIGVEGGRPVAAAQRKSQVTFAFSQFGQVDTIYCFPCLRIVLVCKKGQNLQPLKF